MKRESLPDFSDRVGPAALDRSGQWRYALPVVGLVLLWILAWYASTVKAMAEVWQSDTFAHGSVVLPIVLWLVWRKRAQLSTLAPRPSWPALVALSAAGFAWLVGELAATNAVSQLALTTLLITTVVAILGVNVARALMFPLAFLFFAVPIGQFIMPQLMEWTADMTILGLRLSGVPVYREGLQFVIPSGRWSVVEACSGLRYLIATLMVGTLFAYLTYRSFTRRVVFVAIALSVAIVANWLRAYLTVMIGHLSSNELATGFDHILYGWILFGVLIAVVFWIGGRWREDDVEVRNAIPEPAARAGVVPHTKLWIAGAAVAVVAVMWKVGYWTIQRSEMATPPHLAPIVSAGGWQQVSRSPGVWRPHFNYASGEIHDAFRNGQQQVNLFIAYYRNQDNRRKLVSSENLLVTSDDKQWRQASSGLREIRFDNNVVPIRVTELQRLDGKRMWAWQWYWINGRATTSDHVAKAYTAYSRLLGKGDDSAVVVIYAYDDQPEGARTALERFASVATPSIDATLRQAREIR